MPISFNNNSTGPGTLSYMWDFGDGYTSTSANPTHTFASNGPVVVKLITFSNSGCQDTLAVQMEIGSIQTTFTSPLDACINSPVTFTNTSTPAPSGTIWNLGDGNTGNTTNFTHSYTAPGTYAVKLYNTYLSCVDSSTKFIIIHGAPVTQFSTPDTFRCVPPHTVQFTDNSTGGATSWSWDFGDGHTSNLQNPSHTYNAYGQYTVKLTTSTGFGCTSSTTKTNYIKVERTQISLDGFPQRGCLPYTISPVAVVTSGDVITSYHWDFGDGSTSTAINPTYTYTTQGTYTIRLVVTTATGCSDTLIIPQAVKVGTKPSADFLAAPRIVCASAPVSFTDLTNVADEWKWFFGNGDSSLIQNPVIAYGAVGFFTIKLIATNNGCSDTAIKVRYIQTFPPVANFFRYADCSNRRRFTFEDLSTEPLTWRWNFGDGSPIDTTQNPAHIFPGFGTYMVTLTVTNGGCSDSRTYPVQTIDENPDFVASETNACRIANINFQVNNINPANLLAYTWTFDGSGHSDTTINTSFLHTYNTSGLYSVTLITLDQNRCRDTVIKNNYIRINGPVADFTANNVAGCKGLVTTFTDHSTTDGISSLVRWRFDFGDGIIQDFAAPPFQHTYNTAGVFSVKMIITDAGGCSDSITLHDIIHATDPIPDFVSADTLSCPGATVKFENMSAPEGLTYRWTFGDGGFSTNPVPTHSYLATGNYAVKLWAQDIYGCADSITKTDYIRVKKPVASFTVNDSLSSCSPFAVTFTNTSTFYTSSAWSFGAGQGNTTLENPTHYYSTPGSYQAKLVVTSPGGCTDSAFHAIRVSDTIGTRLNYLSIGGCKPHSLSLDLHTSGQMANYIWDYGDGHIESTQSPNVTHIYQSYGNFLPKVIMEDPSGCIIPLQGLDTVYVTGAAAKFGVNNKLLCDAGTIQFTDSTSFNDPVVKYHWNFGDGHESLQQHPAHQYSAPGIYTVSLTVETQIGCLDTLVRPALIKVVKSPVTAIAGDTTVCIGGSMLHRGVFTIADTSIVRWQWNFPNGNSAAIQNPSKQTYSKVGHFTLTSIAINSSGCKDTTLQTIHVNPLPVITMPSQVTVQTGFPITIPATYSPNAATWQWSPGADLSCDRCPRPVATPKFSTNYQVRVVDSNGCANMSAILLTTTCKNSNVFIPNTFSPNHNGSNDILYPRGKGISRIKSLRIFNRWGQVVFERRDFAANDASYGWDGTFNGKQPFGDVYIYQLEYFCDSGELLQLNGNITIIL